MSSKATILVATDVRKDAELVTTLLDSEFDNVVGSSDPQRAVADFEKHRPAVLILAFDTMEKAERYYLGLYRLSTLVHSITHRTLILCNKDDLRHVYDLCKKEYFDDYVLFWPMAHDALRLPMAVHHALRHLAAAGSGGPTVQEFAAQARRLAETEALLGQYSIRGGARMDEASRSLGQAQRDIGLALDKFSDRLTQGEMHGMAEILDGLGFQHEIERFKSMEITPRLEAVTAAMQPVRDWAGALEKDLAPQFKAARDLQALVELVRSLVLVVDDDEFQHKVLRHLLKDANVELAFATTGTQALTAVGRRRPDLILMDVNLPDINGVDVTRRIKSVREFAGIPIVMITGQVDKEIAVQSVKAGASGFVVKPFNKETLLAKVRSCLNRGAGAAS